MRRAVFLDRDGTMIEERGYLNRLELVDALSVHGRCDRPAPACRVCRGRRHQPGRHRARVLRRDVRAVGACAPEHAAAARRRFPTRTTSVPHHPEGVVEAYRVDVPLPQAGAGHDRAGGRRPRPRRRALVRRRRQVAGRRAGQPGRRSGYPRADRLWRRHRRRDRRPACGPSASWRRWPRPPTTSSRPSRANQRPMSDPTADRLDRPGSRVPRAPRRRRRRPAGRRVHLRPGRACVARGAGAHPALRPHDRRARRGRQRRRQRRRARRRGGPGGAGGPRRRRAPVVEEPARRASAARRSFARPATTRRSRRGFSPAASTRPSSRSCASTASGRRTRAIARASSFPRPPAAPSPPPTP